MVPINLYSTRLRLCTVRQDAPLPDLRYTKSLDIYDNERIVKSRAYLVTLNPPNYCIFNVIDQSAHRVKRKLIGQVVSERSMRIFEPSMTEQIDIFIQQLVSSTQGSTPSHPLNLTPMLKSLGLDVVCLLAFGYRLNTQTSETNHHVRDGIRAVNYFQNTQMQFPLLKRLRVNQILHLFTNARQRRLKYQQTIEHLVRSRLAEDKNAKHDLYSIAASAVDAQEIRTSEIWAEALFFFLAG